MTLNFCVFREHFPALEVGLAHSKTARSHRAEHDSIINSLEGLQSGSSTY